MAGRQWSDPVQLTWTRLPQGFKNSPTLFNEALDEDRREYRVEHPTIVLLQYVDDLMLAAATEKECQRQQVTFSKPWGL